MSAPRFTLAASVLSLAVIAGCNSTTPYPNGSPILGATVDANTAPRGSAEFCRTYARQTAGNAFETASDSNDGFGSNANEVRRARNAGATAYERCLDGRTG